MNAKLLRALVDRHAPDSVKQDIKKLDAIADAKQKLRADERAIELKLAYGDRTPTCSKCGREDHALIAPFPEFPERNGHAVCA